MSHEEFSENGSYASPIKAVQHRELAHADIHGMKTAIGSMHINDEFCYHDRYDIVTKVHVVSLILQCLRTAKVHKVIYKEHCHLIDAQIQIWSHHFKVLKTQLHEKDLFSSISSKTSSVQVERTVSKTRVDTSLSDVSQKLAVVLAHSGLLCKPKSSSSISSVEYAFSEVMNHVLYVDSEAYIMLEESLGHKVDRFILNFLLKTIIDISKVHVRYDPLLRAIPNCESHGMVSSPSPCCGPCGKPVCKRVKHDKDIVAIKLGHPVTIVKELALWAQGTVLTWKLDQTTFCNPMYEKIVTEALSFAMKAWNRVMCGAVTFRCVSPCEDAHLSVVWSDEEEDRLAECPTPAEYRQGSNQIQIFSSLMKEEVRSHVANILAHEVGHLLGFMHGFALTSKIEAGYSCHFPCHEKVRSVMDHDYPQYISAMDVKYARDTYDGCVEGHKIPVPTVTGEFVEFIVRRVIPFDCAPKGSHC